MSGEEIDINDLAAYDSEDDEDLNEHEKEKETSNGKKDTHVGVHSAGFREFLLKTELLRAIEDCGFEHPSEVQQECIPQAMYGSDLICQAKSGMGKTAVFVLSILQNISPINGQVSCVVLCPVRELAEQVKRVFEAFQKYLDPPVKTHAFYGGIHAEEDRKALQEGVPHIVVGTPGRVLQLTKEGALDLKNVKFFVLDECDRMLESNDMRSDVQKIFLKTPKSKQVMMFSATLSDEIKRICKKFMVNPKEVYINDGAKLNLAGLQQYYLKLEESQKNRKLVEIIDNIQFNQMVIFVKTIPRAETLEKLLVKRNLPTIVVHGRMDQKQRIDRYSKFKKLYWRILVTTELLGRGADFERVNIVINYDMPKDVESYLHRVGRAGRFGTKGLGISFISTNEDKELLDDVQKKLVVEIQELPDDIDPDRKSVV